MTALKVIGMRLAVVCALLLPPFAAHAALYLYGPSVWHQGEYISFEVKADADTVLNTYSFDTRYGAFASVLEIQDSPIGTLPSVITGGLPFVPCNSDELGDVCAFSYLFGRNVLKDTVVTRWEFLVKGGAPPGEVSSFDLGVFAATGTNISDEAVPWLPADRPPFQVIAVPESSSWILMIAGLAAVGARTYRRRIA